MPRRRAWEMAVLLQVFLTSALDSCEWSASGTHRLKNPPGGGGLRNQLNIRLSGAQSRFGSFRGIFSPCWISNPSYLAVQPVV